MLKIIIKNLYFYWQKVTLTVLLNALLIFIVLATWMFTFKIQQLSDKPLESLSTEIILEQNKNNKVASNIQTKGVIEPFNLQMFSKAETIEKLDQIDQVNQVSTALILWEFDLKNNKTIVGLDIQDPQVGLRKIESWLTPKSSFFSAEDAEEVILERHFAKLFGYSLGSIYSMEEKDFTIVGIVDFTEQSNLANAQIFMPSQAASALIESSDQTVNQVYISLTQASYLTKVQNQIELTLPNFSIITKDQLLSNLSTFNRLSYKFGTYFGVVISAISLLLILWILKVSRLEFRKQTQTLKFIGWPLSMVKQWVVFESGLLLIASLSISLVMAAIFYWGVLPKIEIGSLFSQNFSL